MMSVMQHNDYDYDHVNNSIFTRLSRIGWIGRMLITCSASLVEAPRGVVYNIFTGSHTMLVNLIN